MTELHPGEYRALVDRIAAEITTLIAAAPAPAAAGSGPSPIAGMIEHTLLRPDAVAADIDRLCQEAAERGFAGVCVNPVWIARAAAALRGTSVLAVTVIGFPLGASLPTAKRHEAAECVKLGADELDMVIDLGALKAGLDDAVAGDIRGVAEVAHAAGARVKVIIEAGLLTDEEKIRACRAAQAGGADFVKTSTGFAAGGATAGDVALMRGAVGAAMGIKASGGIRTLAQAQALARAGATRIGTTAALALLAG